MITKLKLFTYRKYKYLQDNTALFMPATSCCPSGLSDIMSNLQNKTNRQ